MLVDGYRLTWSNMVYYIAPIGVFRCLVVNHKRCHMLELQPSIPVDSATTIKYMPVLNLESEGGHPNEWLLGIEAPFAATTAVPADFKRKPSDSVCEVYAPLIWLKNRFERSKNTNFWEIGSMSSLAVWSMSSRQFGSKD